MLQEFIAALREFSPQHGGIEEAEAARRDLEDVKTKLARQQKEREKGLKKEQKGHTPFTPTATHTPITLLPFFRNVFGFLKYFLVKITALLVV